MVRESLVIALDPLMIPHFIAKEIWHTLVSIFVILIIMLHVSCVRKGQRSHNNGILMTFDLFKQLLHQEWLSKSQI